MFTKEDLKQLSDKGISIQEIEKQLTYFKNGFPYLKIDRAATVGDGMYRLSESETQGLESFFDARLSHYKLSKFVPASGAATRMFKDLYEYVQSSDRQENTSVAEIFSGLDKFAFYEDLKRIMALQHISIADKKKLAETILLSGGLNYGSLPKGMLLFHRYAEGARTALEEHLVEGIGYARNADGSVYIHFTVSPEHQPVFESLSHTKAKIYAKKYGVAFHIDFSQQKPSTDTIAVDEDNRPIRNSDGSFLFRPGGHGALLENLNDLKGDIIFIKNIDNVVPDRLKPTTIHYKKVLAGLLIRLQEELFKHIRALRSGQGSVQDALAFLSEKLAFQCPEAIRSWGIETQKQYVLSVLNRPIRVCGMVKNEGEPGGGPFWVRNADGSIALQIAESSQINMGDQQQKTIAAHATHFNPVDLICGVKDCDGNDFDLLKYRDPDTGFISVKSKDGVSLKAQELPGLWNGAMANWNTLFVEVPIDTFNPVKTINDWLRPQHQ